MTIDTPETNELYQLFGQSPSNINVQSILSTDLRPTISKVSKYEYHAYKPLGISLCFIPDGTSMKLDAIDVYNGTTRDGFQPFTLTQLLPCGLESTMQAHEIVAMLGEPDKKGGGGQSRMTCWIEYQFNNQDGKESGIVIQLHGFEWEDREMGWTSFVLY
jgi:hypothetical protein